MKPNLILLRSALVAALGGLLFGFDTAVISGAEQSLQQLYAGTYEALASAMNFSIFGKTGFWHGCTTASALIGTIVGAWFFCKPADKYGRRTTLFVLAMLYFISAVGSAIAWGWLPFVATRFIGGLAVGGASVVGPIYIAEISPAKSRGKLVALMQLNIVFGILLAYFSNYIIGAMDLGDTEWRWMFGAEAFPAAAFFFLLVLTPCSPRWLMTQKRPSIAKDVLTSLGAENVEKVMKEIQEAIDIDHHSMNEPFFCKQYLKPILLAFTIAAFNQLSGINALLYYSARIFEMAGAGADSARLQSVIVGAVMLIFTFFALLVIDKMGRKQLMLYGSIGYILSLGTVTWAFYTERGGTIVLISFIVYLAAHGFGQGAVIWVFISEIFPTRVRARGQALGSFTHWFMCALIAWTFPLLAAKTGAYAFAFYTVMMILQLLWVIFVMPETKGVPLEQIRSKLGIKPAEEDAA